MMKRYNCEKNIQKYIAIIETKNKIIFLLIIRTEIKRVNQRSKVF